MKYKIVYNETKTINLFVEEEKITAFNIIIEALDYNEDMTLFVKNNKRWIEVIRTKKPENQNKNQNQN